MKLSAGQIKSYWLGAGGDPSRADLMTAIALAESREGQTDAINPGRGAGGRPTNEYSVGLWQINTLVHKNYTREQLKDPAINAREAVRIYNSQGLRAWGSYTDGRYRRYLDAAGATASALPAAAGLTTPAAAGLGTMGLAAFGMILFLLLKDD